MSSKQATASTMAETCASNGRSALASVAGSRQADVDAWGFGAAESSVVDKELLAGVDQAVVSPAAISITAMAAGRSRSNCSGLDEAD